MPGILFVQTSDQIPTQRSRDILAQMTESLSHAPWHRLESMHDSAIGMGRVTIEVSNPEPQPCVSHDERLSIVFEGELLGKQGDNHIAGKNDAELILNLYENGKLKNIENLNGSFAFILWDANKRQVIAMTDRYSSRPLYYTIAREGIAIASEAKAILETGFLEIKVDEAALAEFFTFRHPLDDKTLVTGLKLLPPAGRLIADRRGFRVEEYWKPPLYDQRVTNSKESLKLTTSLLKQAVARCANDVSTGAFLSGGLDSRLLAGIASNYINPFHTFTRGRNGCADHRYAGEVAQIIGSSHHRQELTPDFLPPIATLGVWLTDGLMTCIDFYALSSAAVVRKAGTRALLYGLAGPLGGIAFKSGATDGDLLQMAALIKSRFGVYIPEVLQSALFTPRLFQRIRKLPWQNLVATLEEIKDAPHSYQIEYFCHRFRWPRTGFYGPQSIRSWVEPRLPYYDYEFYEAVYRIPPHFRANRKLQIALLTQICPELTHVRWTYTNLPARWSFPFVARLKRGTRYVHRKLHHLAGGKIPAPGHEGQADYENWFRTALRSWLEEILLSDRASSRGFFNMSFIHGMIEDHMAQRRDYSTQFGLLLTFELWQRIFVDGEDKPTID